MLVDAGIATRCSGSCGARRAACRWRSRAGCSPPARSRPAQRQPVRLRAVVRAPRASCSRTRGRRPRGGASPGCCSRLGAPPSGSTSRLFGLAALLVALRCARARRSARGDRLRRRRRRRGSLVYLPFLVADRARRPLRRADRHVAARSGYWTLPFPLAYRGGFGGPAGWKDALDFYVPLLLVRRRARRGRGGGPARAQRRARACARRRARSCSPPACLLYLRSRTDDFHAQPLDVMLAVAAALSIVADPADARARASRWRPCSRCSASCRRQPRHALLRPPDLVAVDVPLGRRREGAARRGRAVERTVALVDDARAARRADLRAAAPLRPRPDQRPARSTCCRPRQPDAARPRAAHRRRGAARDRRGRSSAPGRARSCAGPTRCRRWPSRTGAGARAG